MVGVEFLGVVVAPVAVALAGGGIGLVDQTALGDEKDLVAPRLHGGIEPDVALGIDIEMIAADTLVVGFGAVEELQELFVAQFEAGRVVVVVGTTGGLGSGDDVEDRVVEAVAILLRPEFGRDGDLGTVDQIAAFEFLGLAAGARAGDDRLVLVGRVAVASEDKIAVGRDAFEAGIVHD